MTVAAAMLSLAGVATRAGGGHSFSGGSSGGGSSGGGGFFFGGGGGGGGIAGFIILIVIALIIFGGISAVKRSGKSMRGAVKADTGNSGGSTPASFTGSQAAAIEGLRGVLFPGTHEDAHAAVSPVDAGLAQIAAHDPAFSQEPFLESVQKGFFIVQEAWTQRKPEMSRQVMADGIWQQHKVQIEQYISEHKRNVLEDLAVGDLQIISAHSDQTYDTITVRIFAACADYDVDDEKGKVIRGNKSVGQWQEDWTFQRSSQATTKPGAGTLNSKCPNCGAPLNVDLQGVCGYCHQPIMGGKYDWVLARIAQVM